MNEFDRKAISQINKLLKANPEVRKTSVCHKCGVSHILLNMYIQLGYVNMKKSTYTTNSVEKINIIRDYIDANPDATQTEICQNCHISNVALKQLKEFGHVNYGKHMQTTTTLNRFLGIIPKWFGFLNNDKKKPTSITEPVIKQLIVEEVVEQPDMTNTVETVSVVNESTNTINVDTHTQHKSKFSKNALVDDINKFIDIRNPTRKEVMEKYGISEDTLSRYVKKGIVKKIKSTVRRYDDAFIGRVQEWIDNHPDESIVSVSKTFNMPRGTLSKWVCNKTIIH